jgi:signal transduction histidine kinase/DNA-binding response OmpR family regulator
LNIGLNMTSTARGWFRDLSIETKMLAIILPLVAVPMIVLGSVGYVVSAGQATTSGARYLKERASDLYTISENPSIRDYYENRYYDLLEEAEVYRQEIEHSLLRFADRMNHNELIYRQVRYVDNQGREIAKVANGAIDPNRTDVSSTPFFQALKQLPHGAMYASPASPAMTYALPVYDTSGGERAATLLGAMVVDFAYPIDDFQRSARFIAISFFIITALSLAGALLLTANRVRRLTRPIRRMADAADQIATGRRDIGVDVGTKDEVGRLAQSFNDMAAALKWNEEALQRKITETTALYEIGQEISAQVNLEPTLDLIVKRARSLLKSDTSMLALREDQRDEFVIRAQTGEGSATVTGTRFRSGEGIGGQVVASGEPLLVGDYIGEYADSPFLQIIKQTSMKSFVAVPLKSEDEVIGVLYVMSAIPHKFQDEDMQLLSALATQATISINNAKLYQQVRQHAEQLETRITERTQQLRQLNQQLEQASEHKSQFLANMSHELRTPLNAIIGYSEILQEEVIDLGQEALVPDLKKVEGAGRHLLGLINDILDLSKVEAGKMDVYLEDVEIVPLLEEVRALIVPLAEKNGNTLEIRPAENLGSIRTDRTKLKQSLLNILSNGSKFTENGRLTLVAERFETDRPMVRFAISDTGIGMTDEQLGRLFQAFSQAEASTTKKYGGTGLGLAISRQFCQLLGGDISVVSRPGEGSTFTITLPARSDAPAQIKPADAPHIAADANNAATVLIVDDDPAARELLTASLKGAGYRLVHAAGGTEALNLARTIRPDAITLDVMMPKPDGWEVLSALKADAELCDIPVVMVSIAPDRGIGLALGAVDVLTKPVDRAQLTALIHRLVRREGPVLVVEDDADTRKMMRHTIERMGLSVAETANGRRALSWLGENAPPAMILLDLMMPEMDGFEFLDAIAARAEWREIPVIVVTAKQLTAAERDRLLRQARKVMEKATASGSDIVAAINEAVRRRPARAAAGAK